MGKKRSQLEMYYDVLKIIGKYKSWSRRDEAEWEIGAKPTRVMYMANLSWLPLQRFLKKAIKEGHIEEHRLLARNLYRLTDKGREWVNTIGKPMTQFHGKPWIPFCSP